MPYPRRATPKARIRARTLREETTDGEKRLWRHLRDRRLTGVKFRRQYPIGPYIADFASVEAKLVVEVDGGQHAKQSEHDAARDHFINAEGFRVIRFSAGDALAHTEDVLRTILRELAQPTPPLCPFPPGNS
jgi:adenine-specific DNA-methyltransferase